jgi:hypothetical protein
VRVRACACVRACVRARARVRVCVCVCGEDVRRAAEARFFELLQDFVAVRAAPGTWLLPTGQLSVSSGHPFLRPARDRSGLRCVAVPPPPPPPPGAG